MILYYVGTKNSLPTPLSIKLFLSATVNIDSQSELIGELGIKSKESAKAFADEIRSMSHDRILFLLFVYIHNFEVNFIRSTYEELVNEIDIDGAWEFDRILNWFENDKINIVNYLSSEHLEFSHPSYSEALSHLLIEDGYITEINRSLFCKILFKLSEADKDPEQAAEALMSHFDMLPRNERDELLLKMINNGKSVWIIARRLVLHLINSQEVLEDRIKALFMLCERERAAYHISMEISRNFFGFPDLLKVDVLLKLSEKKSAVKWVIKAIIENYVELPERLQNVLFELSQRNEAIGYIAASIIRNYAELPNNVKELLIQLSEKKEASKQLSIALHDKFDKIPEDLRTELLYRLSEKANRAGHVATMLFKYFDNFDDKVRNELLFRVSDKETAIGAVARAIVKNYDKFPEEIRVLLFEFIEKDKSIKTIARAIANYFEYLPENVRNTLLVKLSEKEEAAWGVTTAIIKNYNKIPTAMSTSLLNNLSENNRTCSSVATAIVKNYDYVPEDIRNTLLLKLSENEKSAEIVALAVVKLFNKLSKRIRNQLLVKLSKMKSSAEYIEAFIKRNYKKFPKYVQKCFYLL